MGARSDSNADLTGSTRRRARGLLVCLAAVSAAQAVDRPLNAPSPYASITRSDRARDHDLLAWGVEALQVRMLESGQLLRFSYRVADAAKGRVLTDRSAEPNLYDERAHAILVVPVMDQIGKLRQTQPAENGKIYWIVFSNKGGVARRGDRVSVVIGEFRADGLIVE
ncbi:MAG TPA: hypothetical protein VK130_02555 [Steroidobacteraceae bacterium]|nr:hypothetical protein [Steroidobacteraceae bacterium]